MRRYAIVGITALAGILTPPDVFSMVSLAVPLVLLYEISILLVWMFERKKRRKKKRPPLSLGRRALVLAPDVALSLWREPVRPKVAATLAVPVVPLDAAADRPTQKSERAETYEN